MVLLGSTSWAADYVFVSGNNFIYVNNGSLATTTTFSSAVIWSGTSGSTFQNNGRYLGCTRSESWGSYTYNPTVSTSTPSYGQNITISNNRLTFSAKEDSWKWNNSTFYYSYNGSTFSATTSNSNAINAYQITTNNVGAADNTTAPSISCTGVTSTGIQLTHTNLSGNYVPAHTTYSWNGSVQRYYYNNTFYTSTSAFTQTISNPTYTWSIQSGNATVDQNGKVTLTSMNSGSVVVKLTTSNISPLSNKTTTYTITVTNVPTRSESEYGNMSLTPVAATLDLNGTVTLTASASISKTTRTYPVYATLSGTGCSGYYNGTNYSTTAPSPTNTTGTAAYHHFDWATTGSSYYTVNPATSTTSNTTTLTRNSTLTATDQQFAVTVTGYYDNQAVTKTATATITIPMTYEDLSGITCSNMILTYGESDVLHPTTSIAGSGAKYEELVYSSANRAIATVDADGRVTATGAGSTTITIQSKKRNGSNGVSCQVTITVNPASLEAPTISIDPSGHVTLADNNDPAIAATIYYTTDGSDPTTSNTRQAYSGTFTVASETTVKAVATKAGGNYNNSSVVSQFYVASGVSGTVVTLNDLEDHNWTYYAGVDSELDGGSYNSSYQGKMYSPDPRNVKITYRGVGLDGNLGSSVAISGLAGEGQNEMVYYKTLEKTVLGMSGDYPYTVISNPFSKRPKSGSTYYGFAGWKLVSGGEHVSEYSNGQTLPLDATIHFVNLDNSYTPNCTSAEVVFEATWTAATVKTGTSVQSFTGGTYETNFWVITGNSNGGTVSSPCTVTMMTPDGGATSNYRGSATLNGVITPGTNNVKVEFVRMNTTTATSAAGYTYTLGRGIISSASNTYTGGRLSGSNSDKNCVNVVKVESGKFQDLRNFTNGLKNTRTCDQLMILGCDYDRAKGDNTKLVIEGSMYVGEGIQLNRSVGSLYMRGVIKSGNFISNVAVANNSSYTGEGGDQTYYFSVSNTHNTGRRFLTVEGGRLPGIAMGMDEASSQTNTSRAADLRVRGTANIEGVVYGAAEYANGKGTRAMVFTGGTVNGWIAGGANGTQNTNGALDGEAFVYVGGTTQVKSSTSDPNQVMNRGIGGNVFGAGCGYSNSSSSGQVKLGTHVVVADEAYVQRGVYGGGSYGYCTNTKTARLYVTGGHVGGVAGGVNGTSYAASIPGGVYGGACQNQGGTAIIYMNGGVVEGGIYGGSNNTGTMAGSVTMHIDGGQVGTSESHANIHGGGYGQNTVVSQNVDINLGNKDGNDITYTTTGDAVVYGDVYGGSALGKTNGTSGTNTYHTNVTLNAGTINGSLYGGALGSSSVDANVYGPVAVKVYGGSVKQTSADGSGGVYGANNINGAPQRSVTVDIYGTDPAPAAEQYALYAVYGGGNKANYTYANYPTVTVHNCDNSIEYVYGGGNAAAVSATNVTIYGGNIIGNVFGGGNGTVTAANVNGNAATKIYGGTILNVFGGSNSQGTIGGTITVNANETTESGHSACPINVTDLYGGGNHAASNAGQITIGCAQHIGNVYGGANQANISGDINLNITAGHIDNVFGGNNTSGTISGAITVTVDDAGNSCGMAVGNVYGGGNQAAYTNSVGNYPKVHILNGHLTGSVFGGGLGSTAVVTGSPEVVIGHDGHSEKTVQIDGNVFGGGDAANVTGTTNVYVYNCSTTIGTKTGDQWNTTGGAVYGGGNAADVTGGTNAVIQAGNIFRVFGGGNGEVTAANVTGNANTYVHGGTIHQAFAGSNCQGNISGSAQITVDHDNTACDERIDEVYGGGNLAAGNAGTVTIECGSLVGDVYGGANNANVGSAITLNITGGTIDRVFGGNNNGGSISGNITVNINKATNCSTFSVDSVFGAGNAAAYTGTPTVNVTAGTVNYNVYGGGLGSTAVVTGTPVVNLNGGSVTGSLFGGGSAAGVTGSTHVVITSGNAGNVYGGGESADISANTKVEMSNGTVSHCLYGGGLGNTTNVGGTAQVQLTGGTVTEDVYGGSGFGKVQHTNVAISGGSLRNAFGGGFGDKQNNYQADINGNVAMTVSGGTFSGDIYGCNNQNGTPKGTVNVLIDVPSPRTFHNVYGGGNEADATVTPHVTVNGCNATITDIYGGGNAAAVSGTDLVIYGGTIGRVFAGGNGERGAQYAANVNGNTSAIIHGGTINQAFAGSNSNGNITGTASITVDSDGPCNEQIGEVYGGGNLAAGNGGTVTINCGANVGDVYGGANNAAVNSNITLDITGGTVNRVFGGNNHGGAISGTITVNINKSNTCDTWDVNYVYGAGNEAPYTGTPTVNVTKGTVDNNVYGGGLGSTAIVTGTPVVNLNGGTVTGNLFGGGSAADVHGSTDVNITSGTAGNIYGGGESADISANTDVEVTGGTVNQSVYGGGLGNKTGNIRADIAGNVTVTVRGGSIGGDIFGCNNQNGAPSGNVNVIIDGTNTFTLHNVYGGGNEADASCTPHVTINGCSATIADIYGGGNAAAVGGTLVNVNGGHITRVFAGGNGERGAQYAANVTNNAVANIHGGNIGKVFAGSNANGAIGGTQTVTVDHTSTCDELVGEVYGGGNVAYGKGGVINLCNAMVTDVYGGANNADVASDIVLNIKGGTYTSVFGGNNVGGAISGDITVNIEEDDCGEIHITSLYGGGNQAAYNGTPEVNVMSWHSIGSLFGGGLGQNAGVAGTNVNVVPSLDGEVDAENHHAGTIGNVYGGGNAAPVGTAQNSGTTSVLVKGGTVTECVFGGGLGSTAVVNGDTKVTIAGSATVQNNVYGGGNAAEVTGNTQVVVGE